MRRFVSPSLCCLILIAATPSGLAAPAPPGGQSLDDPLEPLASRTARSEQEEDKLKAIALFATGRMFEQRQEYAEALRRYQRALRYDPDAWTVLREMLPLAFSLDRSDEGLRYAVKFAERNPVDPRLLRRGAAYLAESGDWAAALKLCEQAARAVEQSEGPEDAILLQVELGRLYYLTGQTAKSAAAFERVMKALQGPDGPALDGVTRRALLGEEGAIYELMGNVFAEAKRPDVARTAFEEFNKLQPNEANLAANLAIVEEAAGRPEAVLLHLDRYFQSSGPDKGIVSYQSLAWALTELNRKSELIPQLEQQRAKQPDNMSLAFFLGEQYLAAGRLDDAQRLFEQCVTDAPTVQACRRLAEVYRRTQQAAPLAQLLGNNVGSLLLPGDETKQIAGDQQLMTALVAAAGQQARTAGNDGSSLRAVALLAAEAKRWDDTEKLLDVAKEAAPDSADDVLRAWGLGLFLDEQYERAADVFRRGLDLAKQEDAGALYYYLAGALEMADKTDEALAAAKTAAEKRPESARYASRAPWVLYHAKRYDEAYEAYKDVIQRFDGDYSSAAAREPVLEARQTLAAICAERNELPQAVEWLEQVLDEFPDDPGANNDLGYLWADRDQHLHRAHQMIRVAVAGDPENFAYRDSLGWVLFRLGRYSEAVVELEKAAAEEQQDPIVLDHLADTYSKLGRVAEARDAWKRALEGFKKQREQAKMKVVEEKLAATEK